MARTICWDDDFRFVANIQLGSAIGPHLHFCFMPGAAAASLTGFIETKSDDFQFIYYSIIKIK